MLIIAVLLIVFILFVVCIMTITLSDTETFKAIDRKIANKINGKGKWMDYNELKELIEESLQYVVQHPSLVNLEVKNLTDIIWKEMEIKNENSRLWSSKMSNM